MRGAARIGGKSFKVPQDTRASDDGFNPFELISPVGDLPVAPVLEPINDEWSISNFNEPVDEKDCAKYPASPYCENEFIDPFGSRFGFAPEIRTNGCETCLYVYPVIMWLKVQPTIICHRDPNCKKEDTPAPPINQNLIDRIRPPQYPENVEPNAYKSPQCAERESIINRWHNRRNAAVMAAIEEFKNLPSDLWRNREYIDQGQITNPRGLISYLPPPAECQTDLSNPFSDTDREPWVYMTRDDFSYVHFVLLKAQRRSSISDPWDEYTSQKGFVGWNVGKCCGMPSPPPILPPPPLPLLPEGQQGKRGQRGKDMCCNDCADSKENTDKLLREIKEIKKVLGSGKLERAFNAAVGIGDDSITTIVNLIAKRIGTSSYPIEVPESLLTGTDDGKVFKAESNAEYLFWLTKQLDALVGEFPIDIEVKDADPIKGGDQPLKIRIPNIAEAIAEIYGLTFKSSVNQEVELNMLLRLALETTHAKNAAIIAQDYARGNAKFLGYQGNTKGRHVDYNFDFTDVNASQKDQNKQLNLESLLKNSKAWIQGWENDDSETAVNFLRKLMFSAGIIKSVFFRDKKQSKEVVENIKAMQKQAKAQDTEWSQFLKDINDPNSKYNVGSTEKPDINEDKSR